MSSIDWNKQFVKYIRRLQKTPKYKGFTYPCLASVKKIKKEFPERKKLYLEAQNKQTLVKPAAAAATAGGGRRRRQQTRRKRRGGRSPESEGLAAPPDPLPFKGQLVRQQFS